MTRVEAQLTPFVPADAPELAHFAVQAYADAYLGSSMAPEQITGEVAAGQWVRKIEQAGQEDRIIVARYGGALVGYTQFGVADRDVGAIAPDSMELRKLYVATEMHNRGIGRQLMGAALSDEAMSAASLVYLWVWGENDNATRFYGKYDFVSAAQRNYVSRGRLTHDLLMVRPRPSK